MQRQLWLKHHRTGLLKGSSGTIIRNADSRGGNALSEDVSPIQNVASPLSSSAPKVLRKQLRDQQGEAAPLTSINVRRDTAQTADFCAYGWEIEAGGKISKKTWCMPPSVGSKRLCTSTAGQGTGRGPEADALPLQIAAGIEPISTSTGRG